MSLQILGWLEADVTPEQIEEIAGLVVFPLVPLFTATAAIRANLSTLAQAHSTMQLPNTRVDVADFKKFIRFAKLDLMQNRFLVGQ